MEQHELERLGVADLGERVRALGIEWHHWPIRDASIPTAAFEARWVEAGAALCARLRSGGSVAVHCRGGLGRTGLVAACLLIELGEEPGRALQQVRAARPGAVETLEQEDYVLRFSARAMAI